MRDQEINSRITIANSRSSMLLTKFDLFISVQVGQIILFTVLIHFLFLNMLVLFNILYASDIYNQVELFPSDYTHFNSSS